VYPKCLISQKRHGGLSHGDNDLGVAKQLRHQDSARRRRASFLGVLGELTHGHVVSASEKKGGGQLGRPEGIRDLPFYLKRAEANK